MNNINHSYGAAKGFMQTDSDYFIKGSFSAPECTNGEFKEDTTGPVLTVSAPLQGATTALDYVHVTGSASDAGSGLVGVTINGVAPADSASFGEDAALVMGANVITVIATDGSGNTTTVTRNVTRTA
jgi:hypothetical protein